MRWIPLEEWRWETRLTIPELRERLADCCSARKGFVGKASADGFQLTPLPWEQSSFMPRIVGRWRASTGGTNVDLAIVPNAAVQLCLAILFAFLGILVYDRQLERVALITIGSTLLGWLWILSGFLASAGFARQKLQRLMDAIPATGKEGCPSSAPWYPLRQAASGCAITAVVIAGAVLWWNVYHGRLAITTRPAVDLVYIYWATQAMAVGWLLCLSPYSPSRQARWLLLLFALEIVWTWSLVVDGYAGDGRPILTWRWTATRANQRAVATSTSEQKSGPDVDLNAATSHDYPEFRGPRRDGVVTGLRIDPDWHASPPRIIWQQPVGAGWSAYASVGDFAITQEQRDNYETVVCYEIASGHPCWEHRDRALFHEMMGGDGPRATPTIHDGLVYTLGATGILNCLAGRDGRLLWSVNVVAENAAPPSLFGMAGSPLVWRDFVIVAPGGPGASLVAYERTSGQRAWGAGNAAAAYASPQLAVFGGVEQILCFNAEGLFAHRPADGRVLWSIPWVTPPERNNVCQPVVWVNDGGRETVLISSGYGKGCALFAIEFDGTDFAVQPCWRNANLQAKFTSVIERDGYVYGLDNNILCCLDLRSGRRCWKGGRYGFGQVMRIDDYLLVVSDEGEIILCEAAPDEHRELARLPVLHGRTWNHPALSGDRLLIRNDRLAACVQLPVLHPAAD